jgi:hypothetical protein
MGAHTAFEHISRALAALDRLERSAAPEGIKGNKHFDLSMNIEEPHAFIQWKGTDVCMDFWCECGAHLHFDGDFAYAVRCPHCKTIWQMPSRLFPRKADGETYPGHIEMARNMEPDEDFATQAEGGEG